MKPKTVVFPQSSLKLLSPRSFLAQAHAIVSQDEVLTRASLDGIDRLVQHFAQVPAGRRGIVLISPGFLMTSQEFQIDRVIDRALRAQVIVYSLDPKGVPILLRMWMPRRRMSP